MGPWSPLNIPVHKSPFPRPSNQGRTLPLTETSQMVQMKELNPVLAYGVYRNLGSKLLDVIRSSLHCA